MNRPPFRASVDALKPYYKAELEGNPIRLDQNTNLLGPNPALAKIRPEVLDVTNYPTRDADELLAALAKAWEVPEDQLTLGNGSDEILDILVKACVPQGGTIASPWPSYALYPFYSKMMGLKFREVPLRADLQVDVDACTAIKADMLLLATPNNPTGRRIPLDDLRALIEGFEGWVVVDEAYIEFAGIQHSMIHDVATYPNLIVMRTLSKAYGLAGLRIGIAIAEEETAAKLRVVKPPFNLNLYSEAVGIQALQETEFLQNTVATVQAEREALVEGLAALGCRVVPTDANFVLAKLPPTKGLAASEVKAQMLERGMLIRIFPHLDMIADCIRITIGGPEHTEKTLAALKEILA